MEIIEKIVDFNTYCKKCKHFSEKDYEEPCNSCLEDTARDNSQKPANFEEK